MLTVKLPTAMRAAFENISVSAARTPLGRKVLSALRGGVGLKRPDQGWSTNLSFRGYGRLKAAGCLT